MGYLFTLLGGLFTTLMGWFTSALPWIAGYLGATAIQLGISAGFGLVTFTGVDYVFDMLMSEAISAFGGISDSAIQMLGYMWLDKAINLVFSSGVALLTLKGIKGGSVTRQVWNKPNVTGNSIGDRIGRFDA